MVKRYFWRRLFAYFLDIFIAGLLATILIVFANVFISNKILAPSLISSTKCEYQDKIITPERMNQLLPLKEGQKHIQAICKKTNMFVSDYYIVSLAKFWAVERSNYTLHITYLSDSEGNKKTYILSDAFLYLSLPAILAIFLVRYGRTPGKHFLNLSVYNNSFEYPDFVSALKREYAKGALFILGACFSLYTEYKVNALSIDEMADFVNKRENDLYQANFLTIISIVLPIFFVVFWFLFGSFIRWRGRTYWDRFAKLNVNVTDEYQAEKNMKKFSSNQPNNN